jgi:xylulose-5-phosphate/fructose-6-phosphate phosphoketolase
VRGYKEKGNINTPLDLAIRNQIDRFTLAMDVIDRVPSLASPARTRKEKLRNCRSSVRTTRTRTASTSPTSINGRGRRKSF